MKGYREVYVGTQWCFSGKVAPRPWLVCVQFRVSLVSWDCSGKYHPWMLLTVKGHMKYATSKEMILWDQMSLLGLGLVKTKTAISIFVIWNTEAFILVVWFRLTQKNTFSISFKICVLLLVFLGFGSHYFLYFYIIAIAGIFKVM